MYPRAKSAFFARCCFFLVVPGADVNFQPSITSLCTCAHENGFIHESADQPGRCKSREAEGGEHVHDDAARLSISSCGCERERENERRRLSQRERLRHDGAGGFSLMPRRIGFGRVDTFIDNFWRENTE